MSTAELLDDPDAILGASGAGKSYTARKKVELLLEAGRQTIIFDPTGVWYGLRSNAKGDAPGFDVPIFGGPQADVPIKPDQGGAIAGILIEEGASAIIDLSEFEEADLRIFALGFLTRLRRRDRVNLHLVFDEAEEFAPEKVPDTIGFQLVEKMKWVAKRGRVFGLVPTFITQRPADFANSVLSQAQTLYFHQLLLPADQKPAIDYLKRNADKATLDQVKGSLAELQRGERWIYSPRRKLLERGITPPIATFDSMATPAPGEAKHQPRTLAQLDVSKIRAALAGYPDDTVPADAHEAYRKGADVAAMLLERDKRIAELDRENAGLRGELAALPIIWEDPAGKGYPCFSRPMTAAECADLLARYSARVIELEAALLEIRNLAAGASGSPVAPSPSGEDVAGEGFGQRSPATQNSNLAVIPPGHGVGAAGGEVVFSPPADSHELNEVPAAVAEPAVGGRSEGVTPPTVHIPRRSAPQSAEPHPLADRIVAKLTEVAPARLSWRQLASLLGYSPAGGYFRAGKRGALGSDDIVEEGDFVRATVRGRKRPLDRAAAFDLWRSVLQDPAPRIMDALITMGDGTKADLATWLGYSASGGHFRKGLALLRQNGVAIESGDTVRLANPLPGEAPRA
jgi:hypothetical protein